MSKEAPEKIIIPGKPEEVDLSRVHGDIEAIIRFELTGEETYFGQLPDSEDLKNHMNNGGRVFITENDDYLLVDPIGGKPKNSSM